jgi:hypothetical protein
MRPAAAPNAPRIEYHTAAGGPVLGLGTPRPRLSWSVPSAQAGYTQTAYEIEVPRESGIQRYRVQNAEQVLVPWPTDPLRSRKRAEVRVRVAEQEVWPSVNYVMGATYYDAGQRFRDPRLRRQGIQLGAAVSTQIWRVEENGFQFDATPRVEPEPHGSLRLPRFRERPRRLGPDQRHPAGAHPHSAKGLIGTADEQQMARRTLMTAVRLARVGTVTRAGSRGQILFHRVRAPA